MSRKPRTLELVGPEFDAACGRLVGLCAGLRPDVVVGIATGGVVVADAMQTFWEESPQRVNLALKRPSTKVKEGVNLAAVLGRLPRPLANGLRWAEVEMREAGVRPAAELPAPEVSALADGLPAVDRQGVTRARSILIVDDTVDSGRTLLHAQQVVRALAPDAETRTAVLTSTFWKPPMTPDFCLHDRTLIRFPWSMDV